MSISHVRRDTIFIEQSENSNFLNGLFLSQLSAQELRPGPGRHVGGDTAEVGGSSARCLEVEVVDVQHTFIRVMIIYHVSSARMLHLKHSVSIRLWLRSGAIHLGAGAVALDLVLMGHHHHTLRCGVQVSSLFALSWERQPCKAPLRYGMIWQSSHAKSLVLGIGCIHSRNAMASVIARGPYAAGRDTNEGSSGGALCSSKAVVSAVTITETSFLIQACRRLPSRRRRQRRR